MADVLRCTSCGALNRYTPGRADARCGRCNAGLDADNHPHEVDDDALARLVASSPVPVLVDFWAPWCGPCRAVAPHLAALAKRHAGRLLVAKVNTDQHQATAGRLGVQAIPTLAVWSGGELRRAEPGARMGAELEAFIQPWLNAGA
ncbi:MAG TPA: thioredoxin domain-containing protein [Myxococcota bacterium]|nr:thioredoxin domain-containing protein [Myxococcota bacterium]